MELAGVDLNLLVAFDALMAERSVTRAAARMSVGQSAMSATLGRLRRLFDDPLLVRQGRVLVATPRAESLIDPVREALSMIDHTLNARVRFDPRTDRRDFSLVASDYVTYVFLRPLLGRLAVEAPNVRLHLRPFTADFRDRMRVGETDLLILPPEFLDRGDFVASPLFDDQWVCAVDRDNPDVGDTVTVEEFCRQPYMSYATGPLPSLIERQLDAAGISRNVEVTVETFMLAASLLPGTRLLTFLHRRFARTVQDRFGLRLLEPPIPLRPLTEVMAWAARHAGDPGHAWLRGQLEAIAADLRASDPLGADASI